MPEIEVVAPIPPVPSVTPPVNQPVKSKRLFPPIVAVVVVFLLVGLALGAYQFGKNKEPAPTPKLLTTELPTLSPSADPTANWKTYTNTKYGFSLKYPDRLEYKPCTDSLCGTFLEGGKDVVQVEGFSNDCGDSLEPSLSNAEKAAECSCWASGPGTIISCDSPSEESVTPNRNGIPIYRFLLTEKKNNIPERKRGPFYYVFFPKPVLSGGVLYEYGLYLEALSTNRIPELDQILATFKFVDQIPVSNNPASFYDFVGVINLKGYLEPITRGCSFTETETCTETLAIFKVTDSDNTNFNDYLKQLAGNAYVTDSGISLGCLDTSKQQITSDNDSDAGPVQSLITGSQYRLLMSSSLSNPVNLSIERPKYTGGREADDCYSHFRNFRVY